MAVPPVVIRPSVEMESSAGSNEDDITMKLLQIIDVRSNSLPRNARPWSLCLPAFLSAVHCSAVALSRPLTLSFFPR